MAHQKRLYKALKSECEANINEALLTLDLCLRNGTTTLASFCTTSVKYDIYIYSELIVHITCTSIIYRDPVLYI